MHALAPRLTCGVVRPSQVVQRRRAKRRYSAGWPQRVVDGEASLPCAHAVRLPILTASIASPAPMRPLFVCQSGKRGAKTVFAIRLPSPASAMCSQAGSKGVRLLLGARRVTPNRVWRAAEAQEAPPETPSGAPVRARLRRGPPLGCCGGRAGLVRARIRDSHATCITRARHARVYSASTPPRPLTQCRLSVIVSS